MAFFAINPQALSHFKNDMKISTCTKVIKRYVLWLHPIHTNLYILVAYTYW